MNIETPRLALRRPTLKDVARLFEFLGDAEAMQHTHVDASLRAATAFDGSANCPKTHTRSTRGFG
jgi:hypothetical protein